MAKKASAPPEKGTEQVNAYMDRLDHPLKAEVEAVRKIILNTNRNITEQVKWNAPSFSYKGYMATFNLHARDRVLLIFHDGAILNDRSGFLQGDYTDRRLVYFNSMKEVKDKQPALEKAIRKWVRLMDRG